LATSLGARQVCQQAFEWGEKHPVQSVVVSDQASVQACQRFLLDHQILVEPACGAALVPLYDGLAKLERYASILVIVCGGVTVTVEQLQEWSMNFAEHISEHP
jgi:L-serine/L-threonine ammonia-lyase